VNGRRQIGHGLHQKIVFGAGSRDAEGVRFLKCVAADQLRGHLAGERDHRYRIHERVDQAGDQIGGARTGCGAAHADPAGCPGISLGGKNGVLLVPHQDVPDMVIVDGVIKRQRDTAGVAENAIHLFVHKALEEHSCSAHQG
jgi:hypothetical protein